MGSIYDLGQIIQSDSVAELSHVLKDSQDKQEEQRQQEMQQQQQMQQQQAQSQQQLQQAKLDADAEEAEKERQKDILIAEIRAAGYGSMVDLDKNNQNDYRD